MRVVMKFGGTSIDSPQKLVNLANLIVNYKQKGKDNQIVAVVSAVRRITDDILTLANSIKQGETVSVGDFVTKTREIHLTIIENSIIDRELRRESQNVIIKTLNELHDVLSGIVILSEVTPKSLDYLLSFGERLSTPVVSFVLRDKGLSSEYLTGKEVGILTDSNFGNARPLMDTTKLRVQHRIEPLLKHDVVPVVTGFIGADQNGNITTIGRGGSDYTATIVAASINADETWLWTDVDGLMTADPKIVREAQVLKEVSFSEAMEMALFGVKYMHPRALEPVIDTKIPIRIRNIMNVENSGTIISQNPGQESQRIVKSVSAIRHTGLIDVSGTAMAGAPGTAAKIFELLAKKNINIIMISQSPSESSISMVLRKDDIDKATTTLELNLLGKVIKKVEVSNNVAVIAVVGSGMRGIKGVAAKIFNAVAKMDVNVIMITQGSSQLNLAFVVDDNDCESAVRALHKEFNL
jgi:aspartate kinase